MSRRRHRLPRSLYRVALRLYPADFRARFGAAMESSFLRLLDETGSRPGRAVVTARELLDLVMARATGRFRQGAPGASSALPGGGAGGLFERLLDVAMDLRVAARALRGRPTYALVTITVIGLGVGAGVSIYTVIDDVLLSPLPYADGEQIAIGFEASSANPSWDRMLVSPAMLEQWRARSRSFVDLHGYRSGGALLAGEPSPLRVSEIRVTPGTFSMLGAEPLLGRTLLHDDRDTALVSEVLWRGRLGADPDIVGRTLRLDGREHSVVGVMPAGFRYPPHSRATLWRHLEDDAPPADFSARSLVVVGRLGDGSSPEGARLELSRITAPLAAEQGEERFDAANVIPARDMSVWVVRPILWVLAGAVGLLLVIVFVNLSALGVARGLGRSREIAIRAAIGAGRGRLVRLLLAESFLLAALGGLLGVGIAVWGVNELAGIVPTWPPSLAEVAVSGRGVVAGLALAFVMTGAVGLVPGLRLSRMGLGDGLRASGRTAGEGRATQRFRGALVVTQLALAVVLLFGASLMVRSMLNILSTDLGLDPHGVQRVRIEAGEAEPGAAPDAQAEAIAEAVSGVSAIRAVTWADSSPSGPASGSWVRVLVAGRSVEAENALGAEYRRVGPGYLELLRVPVLRGRGFDDRDRAGGPAVALVNERFVEMFLGETDPLGVVIDTLPPEMDIERGQPTGSWQIVGVVPTALEYGATNQRIPQIMVPFEQDPSPAISLMFRGRGALEELTSLVRDAVGSVDAGRAVGAVAPVAGDLERHHRTHRFVMALMISFAVAAVLLAVVGLYGVMAHNVGTRLHEFAVRCALGAEPGSILRMVVRSGLLVGVTGAAIGALAALPLARGATDLMTVNLLIGVDWWDPLTALSVPVLTVGVVIVASLLPARRAARVDARTALAADG